MYNHQSAYEAAEEEGRALSKPPMYAAHPLPHNNTTNQRRGDDDGWGIFIGGFICLCFVILLLFALSYPMAAYVYPYDDHYHPHYHEHTTLFWGH
jgi:hypothetical protein